MPVMLEQPCGLFETRRTDSVIIYNVKNPTINSPPIPTEIHGSPKWRFMIWFTENNGKVAGTSSHEVV